MAERRKKGKSFFHRHSLSIASSFILLLWIVLYSLSNPDTHWGSFFGNAIADWSGLVVTVLATKFMYEVGSAESRRPPRDLLHRVHHTLRNHSLTIFLAVTGIGWIVLFSRMSPQAKWGQVVGNIVSEWTQIVGLVLLTKELIETHSKESKR
jgi:membrane protease YdiL (CAAX protease family)